MCDSFLEDTCPLEDSGYDTITVSLGEPSSQLDESLPVWRKAISASTADEAERIIREGAPKEYILRSPSIQSFLSSFGRREDAKAHVHSFRASPWRPTVRMQQWKKRNFPLKQGGRPTCLLLVGPAHCGKTEWSLGWGAPARLEGGWNPEELMRPGITHVVLDGIYWKSKEWEHLRQIVACQEVVTMSGKYMRQRTVRLGKPVIWTCNEDQSPLRDADLMKFLKQCRATVVKLRQGRKLFTGTSSFTKIGWDTNAED